MRRTIVDRFNAKWIPEPNSGCWLWEATAIPKGYGIIGRGARGAGYVYAHRLSYEMANGHIPDGLFVLHSCDNPYCVNPEHLFLGTQKQNMEDKLTKRRHLSGEQHPNAILLWHIVRQIRAEYAIGHTSLTKLGGKYGITFQHVSDIINRRIWKERSDA